MSDLIRVLLAEDHRLVRAGIRALLQEQPNIEVIAEAENGQEALHLVAMHHPAIAILDIAMPQINGIEAARTLSADYPNIRKIILSMHANEEYVLQALRAGADGYLIKDSSMMELKLAITAVFRGETYLSPAVSNHIAAYVRRVDQSASPIDKLTKRQKQILRLIAEGNSMKEIAASLHISVKTAESHRANLMERLQIYDIPSLVRLALRTGLIKVE